MGEEGSKTWKGTRDVREEDEEEEEVMVEAPLPLTHVCIVGP